MKYRGLKGKVGIQQAAHHNTDEKGAVHLLRDEGQRDGNDRRQQGPEGVEEAAGGLHIAGAAATLAGGGGALVGEDDAHSPAVGTLNHLRPDFLCGVIGGEGIDGHDATQQDQQGQQRDDPSSQVFHLSSLL